jgi:hypothetical protein
MDVIEIKLPPSPKWPDVIRAVEEAVTSEGLHVTTIGTLRTYPGSTHWHVKPIDGGRGTLEITLWPAGRRLWIKIQAGRRAPWIGVVLPRLQRRIPRALRHAMSS